MVAVFVFVLIAIFLIAYTISYFAISMKDSKKIEKRLRFQNAMLEQELRELQKQENKKIRREQ